MYSKHFHKIIEFIEMTSKDPLELFQSWMAEAEKSEPNDPNAMSLATAAKDGTPTVRIVLCKEANHKGFKFHTNINSTKGKDIAENPYGCANFYWKTLGRQVTIHGAIKNVPDEETDAYFKTRERDSQIGAWASRQSSIQKTPTDLEDWVERFKEKFKDEENIPRPKHWVGYRLVPEKIEFWIQGKNRLHERFVYIKDKRNWNKERLYP
jgi:pyridoxamine 5'-phosphate oxidase